MDHETDDHHDGAHMLHRLVFFSDAVFAIVLTLLVLELRPPEHVADAGLLVALGHMAPHFIAFASSFGLISIFWAAHMSIMRRMTVFDWPVAWLNLVFLFTIALMPFASALIGELGVRGNAWRVYSIILIAASVTQCALVIGVNRGKGRLTGGVRASDVNHRLARAASPGIVFSIGLGLGLSGYPRLSAFCWLLFPPVLLLARLLFHRKPGKPGEPVAAPEAT